MLQRTREAHLSLADELLLAHKGACHGFQLRLQLLNRGGGWENNLQGFLLLLSVQTGPQGAMTAAVTDGRRQSGTSPSIAPTAPTASQLAHLQAVGPVLDVQRPFQCHSNSPYAGSGSVPAARRLRGQVDRAACCWQQVVNV